MEKVFDLSQLKNNYDILKEKYNLPSFDSLNKDFGIEKIAESETDFILREVRKYVTDKFFNYLRLIESILNPSNSPLFVFAITKTINLKEKEKLMELYKQIARIEIDAIELDLDYSEDKEAESIKKYYEMWQNIKKELLELISIIKKNLDIKTEDNGKGYFG